MKIIAQWNYHSLPFCCIYTEEIETFMVTRHTQSCVDEDGPEGGDVELCTISQSLSLCQPTLFYIKKKIAVQSFKLSI